MPKKRYMDRKAKHSFVSRRGCRQCKCYLKNDAEDRNRRRCSNKARNLGEGHGF